MGPETGTICVQYKRAVANPTTEFIPYIWLCGNDLIAHFLSPLPPLHHDESVVRQQYGPSADIQQRPSVPDTPVAIGPDSIVDGFGLLEPVATKGELWGSEGFAGAAMNVFIPLINSSMARAVSTDSFDHTKLCVLLDSSHVCQVLFGAFWVSPASFSLYTSAVAVGIQAVMFIWLGALADYSSGSVCYGASQVFHIAYLPRLTRNHPNVRDASPQYYQDAWSVTVSSLSAYAKGVQHVGGHFVGPERLNVQHADRCLVRSFVVVSFHLRNSVQDASTWWARTSQRGKFHVLFVEARYALGITALRECLRLCYINSSLYIFLDSPSVYRTTISIRKLSQIYKFLFAWFLLSDGFNT
ncbi:hypothetical protein BC936DRAFT_139061, partial [Jimgerdemannia flammicorona]